ncbi:MAG: hypothetical protein LBR66_09040, partial [Candidatus Symbiothrix sp.]|nr:hypothetical protein [Candidatus Symbiothrix sp.]
MENPVAGALLQLKSVGDIASSGAKWLALTSGNSAKEWFYMPSFNLPITATGTGKTFDLYGEYVRQFTAAGNAQFVTNAPSS